MCSNRRPTGLIIILSVSLPAFDKYYRRQQVDSAAGMIESMVQRARMSALKQKIVHRVVFHDENAATPNTVELQRKVGGSFSTIPGQVLSVPGAVRILGTGPMNSLDDVTVSGRGECSPGNVYVSDGAERTRVVAIASTCFTSSS